MRPGSTGEQHNSWISVTKIFICTSQSISDSSEISVIFCPVCLCLCSWGLVKSPQSGATFRTPREVEVFFFLGLLWGLTCVIWWWTNILEYISHQSAVIAVNYKSHYHRNYCHHFPLPAEVSLVFPYGER